MTIYQSNFLFTLIHSLQKKFASVEKLLGKQNFKFFSKKYIDKTPSLSSNIDDYGENFSSFLFQQREFVEMPYIESLAQLDWFFFIAQKSGESIKLPVGILELWQSLINDTDLPTVTIDETLERILIHMDPLETFLYNEKL